MDEPEEAPGSSTISAGRSSTGGSSTGGSSTGGSSTGGIGRAVSEPGQCWVQGGSGDADGELAAGQGTAGNLPGGRRAARPSSNPRRCGVNTGWLPADVAAGGGDLVSMQSGSLECLQAIHPDQRDRVRPGNGQPPTSRTCWTVNSRSYFQGDTPEARNSQPNLWIC